MKKVVVVIIIILLISSYFILDNLGYLPHRTYTNKDFNIENYYSSIDKDHDGIDDQSDILINVRNYIKTKPKYQSKYYANGYPDDNYGVCTDVVAFGLKDAGYDLKELVYNDISLTTDINDIASWQGGDIVVFPHHIGIVSDKRNKQGIPYLIHHSSYHPYEEDILEELSILGHFRVS